MVAQKQIPAGELYNLRWNNYSTNLIKVFWEQQNQDSLVDVTLSCEGQFIKAHRLVLSACSGYFQKVFESHTTLQLLIILNDMKFEDLKLIIQFMYSGEVKLADCDLQHFLALGKLLEIKGLCAVDLNENRQTPALKSASDNAKLPQNTNTPPQSKEDCQKDVSDSSNSQSSFSDLKKQPKQKSKSPRESSDHDGIVSSKKRKVLSPILQPPDVSKSNTSSSSEKGNKQIPQPSEVPKSYTISPSENKQIPQPPDVPKSNKMSPSENKQNSNKNGNGSAPSQAGSLKNIPPVHIPRPPNAFMIFANQWRKKLAVEHPDDSNKDISVRLGNMWKNLSQETKEAFYDDARKAEEEHKLKYPGYSYNPKEARHRKIISAVSKPYQKMDALSLVNIEINDTTTDDDVMEIKFEPEDP